MATANLTAARLREVLSYDSETGEFRWIRGRRGVGIGSLAGCVSGAGYVYISVDCKKYLAHRLAWFYTHGVWPSNDIDHINWIRTDNRLANLRDVERHVNNENRKRVRGANKSSGLAGVSWHIHSRKWRARITQQGVEHRVELFDTPEEASAAYVAAKRRLHAGCTI